MRLSSPVLAAASASSVTLGLAADPLVEYGTDISYPMHYNTVSKNYPWLAHNVDPGNNPTPPEFEGVPVNHLGDMQSPYETFMSQCREANRNPKRPPVDRSRCDESEAGRIRMNLMQPQSMINYTSFGVKKVRAPGKLMTLLTKFWEDNRNLAYPEDWAEGNTYTNNFLTPSYMLAIENSDLPGGGKTLQKMVWDAAVDTIQKWTGQNLQPSSLYGIRVYKEGAILAPHVDRLPLVSSAIINVAQDVDEDWPIEVIAHDGKAHNITMKPGDLVLYESHSVIHGRPFPLKGRFYANVFIHFVPEASDENELPDYMVPGSPYAIDWMKQNNKIPEGQSDLLEDRAAHIAADIGDMEKLRRIAEFSKGDLDATDSNGWRPLHEAARSGHVNAIQFLLDKGADINARTWEGNGGSALYWATQKHGTDHPAVKLLQERGARLLKPTF